MKTMPLIDVQITYTNGEVVTFAGAKSHDAEDDVLVIWMKDGSIVYVPYMNTQSIKVIPRNEIGGQS